MIRGIGCDIVDLKRINVENDRLAQKILSDQELAIYNGLKSVKSKRQYLGSRFCVKEAFYKATSDQNLEHTFKSLSVLNDESGKPYLNFPNSHVSISHENDIAIAYVIIEE